MKRMKPERTSLKYTMHDNRIPYTVKGKTKQFPYMVKTMFI